MQGNVAKCLLIILIPGVILTLALSVVVLMLLSLLVVGIIDDGLCGDHSCLQ